MSNLDLLNLPLENGDTQMAEQQFIYPTLSAVTLYRDSVLLTGISCPFSNNWIGGLGVYQLDDHSSEEKLTPKLCSLTTFEYSVASMCLVDESLVFIGLDDGSVQAVRLPQNYSNEIGDTKNLTLSINSASYHDWPIRRLVSNEYNSSTGRLSLSLDTGGIVKQWDLEQLVPINSWSIQSHSWPLRGQALDVDISLCPPSSTTTTTLIATLSPCDSHQQMALWDVRVNSMRGPSLHFVWPQVGGYPKDMPRSLCWSSPNHLLLGTFNGLLHTFDARNIRTNPPQSSVAVGEPTDVGSWMDPYERSGATRQITGIIAQSSSSSADQKIALLGPAGSLVVLDRLQSPAASAASSISDQLRYRWSPPSQTQTRPHLPGTGLFLWKSDSKFLHATGFPDHNDVCGLQLHSFNLQPDFNPVPVQCPLYEVV